MIQAAIILAIVAAIFGTGTVMGKKWEKSVWQPTYYQLAEQMATMQSELNIKTEIAKGEANTVEAEVTVIGKVSEVENEKLQAEVNHRVERYLDQLLINGVQPIRKENGIHNESGTTHSLPDSARSSIERGGEDGLFADLDEFERATLKKIIKRAEHSQTLNIVYQDYLKKQEEKMKPLRGKYKTN